jgi:hypothetical protein
MNIFLSRILRAIKLETQLFEEVEADRNALPQALGIVILSSLAVGLAALSKGLVASVFSGTLGALLGWFVWSYLIFFIGTRWLAGPETKADYGQVLRTVGFAAAPGLIAIIGILPFLYNLAISVSTIWMLVATVIAVRQALDYRSIGRAVIVSLIGWIIFILISWLFRLIF